MTRLLKIFSIALIFIMLLLPACNKPEVEEKPQIVIPEAIDLGLSVKWASFDVGATKPGEAGTIYSWGETEPKSKPYNWENYKWCKGSANSLTKYNFDESYGDNPDYRIALKPEDDVAHILYGGDWRMPTAKELKELIESPLLIPSIEKVGHLNCLKFTSTLTGQSILFPAGGWCDKSSVPLHQNELCGIWSAELTYSPSWIGPSRAHYAEIHPELNTEHFIYQIMSFKDRSSGMNVRAVYDPGSGGVLR